MEPKDVLQRIVRDIEGLWGTMAVYMIKKRLTDIGVADVAQATMDDIERIIELLGEKTLPSTLGREGAMMKVMKYMSWLREARAV